MSGISAAELPQYAIDAGMDQDNFNSVKRHWAFFSDKLDGIDSPEKAAALLMIAATDELKPVDMGYRSFGAHDSKKGTLSALFENKPDIAIKGLELALTKHFKEDHGIKAFSCLIRGANINQSGDTKLSYEAIQSISDFMTDFLQKDNENTANDKILFHDIIDDGLRTTEAYLTDSCANDTFNKDEENLAIDAFYFAKKWLEETELRENGAPVRFNHGVFRTLNNQCTSHELESIEDLLVSRYPKISTKTSVVKNTYPRIAEFIEYAVTKQQQALDHDGLTY